MTAIKSTIRFQTLGRVLLPLLLVGTTAVHGQTPAQLPLLTKAGAAVAPNVMLTLDDSGSMAFRHMPENVFAGGTYATTNPVGSQTVFWDKNDTYQNTTNVLGTVPGILASANYRLRGLRSADTNTIYYNPEIRYQPWLTSDGVTRLPNSPVATAYEDPLVRTLAAGTYIDLTVTTPNGTYTAGSFIVGATYTIVTHGTTSFTTIGAGNNNVGTTFVATGVGSGSGTASTGSLTGWCFADTNNANCTTPASTTFLHDPGVYFRLTKTGSVYNDLTVATNYTAYTINASPTTTYTKYPDRLDCAGTVCTRTEERQNFANWFTYYRNRNLLARGGLMEAFGVEATPVSAGNFVIGSTYAITSVGSTSFTAIGASANTVDTVFTATGVGAGTGTARAIAMRLGFGRINKASASVDGVNTGVLESSATYGAGGVRDFNKARKDNLFKWLEDLPASGGTPLVGALEANGVYYSRTDNRGPWTDNPAVNTNVVANNKTCRRSYTFLSTDGYWTTAGTAGNSDNTAGATITSVGSTISYPAYTYTPVAPFKDDWSNTLADTAMKYWKTDLQPATVNSVPPVGNNVSFWQNMTTFTIGLGVRGTLNPDTDLPALTAGTKTWPQASATGTAANVDDLWHAAVNSRGQYFSVNDPQELATAIRTALARATGGTGSTAGVAAASSTLQVNNRKYKLEFDPGSWNGEISAISLDVNGQAVATVWAATAQNPASSWSSRNIVTFDSTPSTWSGIGFDWASIPSTGKTALGAVAAAHPTEFINFLKGDHTNEGLSGLYRTRVNPAGQPFFLGDFVNANPALIRGNFDGVYTDTAWGGSAAYNAFKVTKAARTPVLFAGSNDGMLHAFRDSLGATPATDGREIFAYVPRAVYNNLDKLADKNYGTTGALPHQYFVDGPLAEADAYVKAPGATTQSWRNYLMGALGAGGRAVFALDVTDTANLNASTVRWEMSSAEDPDIGYVLSNVRIGVLPSGRWVAVFGNGYGSTGGTLGASRAVLFVVDLEDYASNDASVRAAAIHKTVLDSTAGNGLGGVTLIHDMTTGRTTTIYVGDLKGNMWKLNYNPPTGVPVPGSPIFDADGGAPFFTATDITGVAQPITASPAVFKGPSTQGYKGYLVAFGTGKLFSSADGSDTSPQTIYSVWDKRAGPTPLTESVSRPMSRSNLVSHTLTAVAGTGGSLGTTYYSLTGAAVDYSSAQRGFYIDLNSTISAGRVVYPVQVLGYNTAYASAVAPVQGIPAACDSGSGTGMNLAFPVDTGVNPSAPSFDTNGDGAINASDSIVSGFSSRADGGDVAVSSQAANGGNPLVDTGGGGPVGDCTGDGCVKNKCVPSPTCGPKECLVVLEYSGSSQKLCRKQFPDGTRIWRRIINPPIK